MINHSRRFEIARQLEIAGRLIAVLQTEMALGRPGVILEGCESDQGPKIFSPREQILGFPADPALVFEGLEGLDGLVEIFLGFINRQQLFLLSRLLIEGQEPARPARFFPENLGALEISAPEKQIGRLVVGFQPASIRHSKCHGYSSGRTWYRHDS